MSTETTTREKTDLEKFQALRIEALELELLKAKDLLLEMQKAIENYIKGIEVVEPIEIK
jgi:hypothetical protein